MRPGAANAVRLIVSAIVAAGMAGFVMALLIGVLIAGPIGLFISLFVAPGAALVAIKYYGLPALVLGALLWLKRTRFAPARRAWFWALIGAAAGGATFLLPLPVDVHRPTFEEAASDPALFCLFLALAGAAAALSFRGTMRLTDVFVANEDD
jgi:hypothetical protein